MAKLETYKVCYCYLLDRQPASRLLYSVAFVMANVNKGSGFDSEANEYFFAS